MHFVSDVRQLTFFFQVNTSVKNQKYTKNRLAAVAIICLNNPSKLTGKLLELLREFCKGNGLQGQLTEFKSFSLKY